MDLVGFGLVTWELNCSVCWCIWCEVLRYLKYPCHEDMVLPTSFLASHRALSWKTTNLFRTEFSLNTNSTVFNMVFTVEQVSKPE
jgi:hypothetical protein